MIRRLADLLRIKKEKAQSFIELALVLPIILLILLGVVEVSFFISRYLDVMDLTREAARVASNLDPQIGKGWSPNTYGCDKEKFPYNFYYTTACIFAPPVPCALLPTSPPTENPFCGGINPVVSMNPAVDDVVISIFAIHTPITGPRALTQTVLNAYPELNPIVYPTSPPPGLADSLSTDGYWAFSTRDTPRTDPLVAPVGNWQKDCEGNVVLSEPHYTTAVIEQEMKNVSHPRKGVVSVKFFYCYHQVLGLPIANWFVPDPLRIHAYSLMPLPAVQPYPTPTLSPP
ncbi:MAG: TadE/TadG family type IV pilus assembly protein [Leptolinea sp.]